MASEFMSLNEMDTKELRKQLGLPTTKDLRYFHRESVSWIETKVVGYEIVDTYQPSGTHSLLITLEDDSQVRILADYFVDMQKATFLSDVSGKNENGAKEKVEDESQKKSSVKSRKNRVGKRIDKLPTSYVVLDLETTGTNHYKDEIIEVGAIKYNNGKEVERLSLLIDIETEIPNKVIELTGITNEMISNEGKSKGVVMLNLCEFLGDYIVVGHNIASFDSKFLDDAYKQCLGFTFPNDYVDTLFLARQECSSLEHHRLADLSELYNIDYSKAHRAIEDCIINHLVYEKLAFGRVQCEDEYKEYFLQMQDQPLEEDFEVDEMVEIEESEYFGWKKLLDEALEEMALNEQLPPKSLGLKPNLNREGDKITSYSICIYEPDLIEDKRSNDRYSVVCRISEKLDMLSIEPKNQEELTDLDLPKDAKLHNQNKAMAYYKINQNSENLIPYLKLSVK